MQPIVLSLHIKFVKFSQLHSICISHPHSVPLYNEDISIEGNLSYGLARFNKDTKIRKCYFVFSAGVFILNK